MKNGFTLLELLIVISILGVVLMVVLPNFKGIGEEQKLKSTASEIQTAFRTAQNNASSGVKCGSTDKSAPFWLVKALNSNTIQIKLVCPTPGNPNRELPYKTLNPSASIGSVNLYNASGAGCSLDIRDASVRFSNISASIDFTASSTSECSASQITDAARMEIALLSSGSFTYKVVVDKGGGIYVKRQ